MAMELENVIKQIVKTYNDSKANILTEEATKMSLIAPLIQALGYNIFNPSEVAPEYNAELGNKKMDKIDYAIINDGKPIMIIECKWSGAELTEDNKDQLLKYFVALPDVKIAILTNGLTYKFFTDLDKASYMDAKPYFQFDIREIKNHEIKALEKYAKPDFKIGDIINAATGLKYTGEIKRYIEAQMLTPDEAFVKCIMSGIDYPKKASANIVEQFKQYTKNALNQFLNETLNDRLEAAIKKGGEKNSEPPVEQVDVDGEPSDSIATTQDEIDGFNIVRAILRKHVPIKDLAFRDTKSYSSVLYKNKNHSPVCRFYFNNPANLQLALISLNESEKGVKKIETKIKLESLDDIYSHEDELLETLKNYLEDKEDVKETHIEETVEI
jgi:hypothetical protein